MNKNEPDKDHNDVSIITHHLDITPETCPMTFVRTRLMIEKMAPGDIAEVRLRGAEPLENVPRSVTDMGHSVLSLEAEDATGDAGDDGDGVFRLRIRRN